MMFQFRDQIIKLLVEYRALLGRQKTFAAVKRMQVLHGIDLGRKALKCSDDAGLYRTAKRIVNEVEACLKQSVEVPGWYSGFDEFHQHLKAFMAHYKLVGGKVIHTTRTASNAMVSAIQLMLLPDNKLTRQVETQLIQLGQTIHHYGSKEQVMRFIQALRKRSENNPNFFLPLLDSHEPLMNQCCETASDIE